MINTKPAKVEKIDDEIKFRNCIHSLVSGRSEIKVWWNTRRIISQNSNVKLNNTIFWPDIYD